MVTEFNYPFVNVGRTPIATPLDRLIETILANKNDPFKVLEAGALLWFKGQSPSLTCLDWDANLYDAVPLIQPIPFIYVQCKLARLPTSSNTLLENNNCN